LASGGVAKGNTIPVESEIGSTKSTTGTNVLTEKAAPIIIKEVEMPKLSVNVNVRPNSVRFQSPKKAEVRAALRNVNDLHGANSDMNYNSFARSMISRFVNGAPAFDLYNSESYVEAFGRVLSLIITLRLVFLAPGHASALSVLIVLLFLLCVNI